MKTSRLMTIIPLAAAITIGQAWAQGSSHQNMINEAQQQASFQGNPHFDVERIREEIRYVEIYRGNPHEGFEHQVVRVAGNPHEGFKIVPLTIAGN